MKKPWIVKGVIAGTIFVMAGAFAADANAGHRYRGWDDGWRHYSHYGYHHRRHRHHRHHSRRGAYLVGGLVLGSLLTHAYHRSHEPVVVHRSVSTGPRVTRRVVSDYEPRSTGRRLFRDRDGNCFERTTARDGSELLVELDPMECAW